MRGRRFWLGLIGGMWLVAGVIAALWGIGALLPPRIAELFPIRLPHPAQAFIQALSVSSWAGIVAVVGGLFSIVLGLGFVRRYSWAQTVGIPAHLLFLVYGIVGSVAGSLLRSDPDVWWEGAPIFFAILILVNAGFALFLSGVKTTEALSWLPLQTAPVVPLKCEFCGTALDPETKLCPQCSAVPESVQGQLPSVLPSAKLVRLSDQTEFRIDPRKRTRIGRGLRENEVELNNPTVSRHHAQIEYQADHFVLAALRDSNGTFINDTLIRQRTLRDGDEIRFGRVRFRFVIDQGQGG